MSFDFEEDLEQTWQPQEAAEGQSVMPLICMGPHPSLSDLYSMLNDCISQISRRKLMRKWIKAMAWALI